ncbi:MAG: hypothetical protein HY470_00240 [Candidatus Ryanbacteria bacterium]|nr:hypothetical protein [Candidatus Ryanbacteria bacterium]
MPLKLKEPDMLFRASSAEYPPRHKNPAFMSAAFFMIIGFGYILFHSSSIFVTPDLFLDSPQDGELVRGGEVEIFGSTEPKTPITINGYELLSDEAGSFAVTLPMQPGYNVVDVRVKNRVGKETKVVRRIVVE